MTGSGKSSAIIGWMNDNPQNRYIYVSPTLTEVTDRIPNACEALDFVSPEGINKTKSEHLLELLQEGFNISCTHALFEDMHKGHFDAIKIYNYILISDETLGMVSKYDSDKITAGDIKLLLDAKAIEVDQGNYGKVSWIREDTSPTKFNQLRSQCLSNQIFSTKDVESMLVTHLPEELLSSSKRVVVLTYMFKGSVLEAYLKLKKFKVETFTEVVLLYSDKELKERARKLITIGSTRSTEKAKEYSQSATWFTKKGGKLSELKDLAAAIRSVYRKHNNPKDTMMVTCVKDVIEPPSKARYGRSIKHRDVPLQDLFLYSRVRGTNLYDDKNALVHCYNRYLPISVRNYFIGHGVVTLSDDDFAISELVQWVYRSAIRKGEAITIYFTTNRMQSLFEKWLQE